MTSGLMRGVARAAFLRAGVLKPNKPSPTSIYLRTAAPIVRGLANVRDVDGSLSGIWFNGTPRYPQPLPQFRDHEPPDERTLKLGKTVRILHERLPTLLASPLPQEILSPQITLHLFPSTHPHLPTVTGKIAYTAALWTAPVAWGRFPVVGNVKLIILSERMVRNGGTQSPHGYRSERLIVRWKTCGKTKGKGVGALYRGISGSESRTGSVDKITEFIGDDPRVPDDKEFCGLFLFEFDEEGRIVSHTIEHVDEGSNWEKMPMVVNVTDWLLGKAWGKKDEVPPGIALNYLEMDDARHLRKERRDRR